MVKKGYVLFGVLFALGLCIAGWQRVQLGRLSDERQRLLASQESSVPVEMTAPEQMSGQGIGAELLSRFQAFDPDRRVPDAELLGVTRLLATAPDEEIAKLLNEEGAPRWTAESYLYWLVLEEFAERDLRGALDLAFEAERRTERQDTFGLLLKFAASHPDEAVRWLVERRESEDGARAEHFDSLQQAVDQGVLRGEMQRDPVAAANRIVATASKNLGFTWGEQLMDCIGPGHWGAIAEIGVAQLSEGNRLLGRGMLGIVVQSMVADLGFDEAWQRVGTLGLDGEHVVTLSRRLVLTNMVGAGVSGRLDRFLDSLPPASDEGKEAFGLAASWTRTEPARAAAWLASRSSTPDLALEKLSRQCGSSEGKAVIAFSIADPDRRDAEIARIRNHWQRLDPEAAEAFFAALEDAPQG